MLPGALVVGVGIVTAVLSGTDGMSDVGVGSSDAYGVGSKLVGTGNTAVGVGEVVGVLIWPTAGRDATVTNVVASRIDIMERPTFRCRIGFGAW